METRLTLRPGQPGTKKLTARYGTQLVCVRYRYDLETSRRYTTVELIVDQTAWTPRPRKRRDAGDSELVALRISYNELGLRIRLADAGAVWNPALRCWIVSRSTARKLRLTERIVGVIDNVRAQVRDRGPRAGTTQPGGKASSTGSGAATQRNIETTDEVGHLADSRVTYTRI